jgi:hypothetical protein
LYNELCINIKYINIKYNNNNNKNYYKNIFKFIHFIYIIYKYKIIKNNNLHNKKININYITKKIRSNTTTNTLNNLNHFKHIIDNLKYNLNIKYIFFNENNNSKNKLKIYMYYLKIFKNKDNKIYFNKYLLLFLKKIINNINTLNKQKKKQKTYNQIYINKPHPFFKIIKYEYLLYLKNNPHKKNSIDYLKYKN